MRLAGSEGKESAHVWQVPTLIRLAREVDHSKYPKDSGCYCKWHVHCHEINMPADVSARIMKEGNAQTG